MYGTTWYGTVSVNTCGEEEESGDASRLNLNIKEIIILLFVQPTTSQQPGATFPFLSLILASRRSAKWSSATGPLR